MEQISRTERQKEGIKKWLRNKGIGTLVYGTGVGKTFCAIMCIKTLLTKFPDLKVIVVVPTEGLYEQWIGHIDGNNLSFNCTVKIINTVIKEENTCDLLVMDECHRYNSTEFSKIFNSVQYKYILGLTATFERLDGKEIIMQKYCPPIDQITLEEALLFGWVSEFKEYLVLIDVPDIEEYLSYNKEFVKSFEFFNFDWNLVNRCIGKEGFIERARLRDEICPHGSQEERKKVFTNITYHATNFMRALQKRKAFINNHPKKLELARKIINSRPFSKIITFSNNVKMAEAIGIGNVYSGKDSKKKGRMTIDEFKQVSTGVLNTIQRANEGLDIPNLSVAIIIGTDSSKIKSVQRTGRVVRKEGDKQAEIFNIVINQTVECEWFRKSHEGRSYITIDEQGLDDVLAGKEPKPYNKKVKNFQFRF